MSLTDLTRSDHKTSQQINRELDATLEKSKLLIGAAIVSCMAWLVCGCGEARDKNGNATVPHISTPALRDALILEELQKQTALLREIRDQQKRHTND